MSDLLSYSIMYNGSSSTTTTNTPATKQPMISLPPLSPPSMRQLPPFHHLHNHHQQVILPPIIPSNYTTAKPISLSGTTTPQRLTESNLDRHHHGLGLLTSAMMNMEQQPPSLTSSSSCSSIASLSSPSSPEISHANHNNHHQKRRQRLGPSCDSCRLRKVKCNAEINILSKDVSPRLVYGWFPHLNQQQMDSLLAGQLVNVNDECLIISHEKLIKFKSCNSCKAKQLPCCFSKGFTKEDIMNHKKNSSSSTAATSVAATNVTSTATTTSPGSACHSPKRTTNKIIKKKVLKLKPIQPVTLAKQEEMKIVNQLNQQQQQQQHQHQQIVHEKLLQLAAQPQARHFQDQQNNNNTSRKSSCASCRKRKVKCVFNPNLNKCEGCNKKNSTCVFDKQK